MRQGTFPNLRQRGFVMPRMLNGSYESAAATGARAKAWNPSGAGPNAAATSGLSLQRRRARDAVRNDPWAKAAMARMVSNAIGTGIQPYPKHPDKHIAAELKRLWADWVNESDADGRLDFYGQQAVAAQALFTDGEVLGRLRPRRLSDGLAVPLQLQTLEGDHLPETKTEVAPGGNEIVNGVEFNAIGQRVAYHLYARHPGEYGPAGTSVVTKRVPADQVLHAFKTLRPGQVRGVSELATVLLRLKSLDNLDDAVLRRQEVANLFAGFVSRKVPDEGEDMVTGGDAEYVDGQAVTSLEPGTMNMLLDNEQVTFSSPPGAPDNYAEFMRQQLMAAFASVGLPYELATGDLRGVSDRVLRVIINDFQRSIMQYQWLVLIQQWCRPVWAAFVDTIVLNGILPAPDYYLTRRDWLRVDWVPQGWAYMNPIQDATSRVIDVRGGSKTLRSVILERGDDPDAVMADHVAQREFAREHGLVFDSDAGQVSQSGVLHAALLQDIEEEATQQEP